jgi:hypothetical protein
METHEIPTDVARSIGDQHRRDQQNIRQFGHVRPPRTLEAKGYKFVIAGGGLVVQRAESAKYFTDILLNFVPSLFGPSDVNGLNLKLQSAEVSVSVVSRPS